MEKIRVVLVPTDGKAVVVEIDNDLHTMQELVGGYIETARIFDAGEVFDGCRIVCNEEGIIRRLKLNKLGIRGQFFIISDHISGDGEMVGLEEGKAHLVAAVLNSNGG